MHRVGVADGVGSRFRQPEVDDLARLDELLDGAGDVFDGNCRVDTMLVVEIDAIGAQAAQRAVDGATDAGGIAAEPARGDAVLLEREPELGGDDDVIAEGSRASPTMSSLVNGPYTSALSNKVTPSSTARRTRAMLSARSGPATS